MLFQSHDRNLINRCLQNNRLAQKELFDRYYKAMFNIALRIVKDEELCYDVVQETFIHVFNNLEQFQFKATIGSWIKTILVREALRRMKLSFRDIIQKKNNKSPLSGRRTLQVNIFTRPSWSYPMDTGLFLH